MPSFSQANSPMQVFTPMGDDVLLGTSLKGSERLGDSFEFTVDLLAAAGTEIPFSKLMGATASVEVIQADATVRNYHGMVWQFTQYDADSVFDHYRMVLKPKLAMLGLTRRSRIFQGLSALDIIRQIVAPVGGAEIQMTGVPPVRVYCTQYRETDLEFFLRLCSEEGIIHYWRHTRDEHTLVLTDTTSDAPSLGSIDYDQTVGGSENATFIRAWALTQTMVPTSADVTGSHFQLFGQNLGANARGPVAVPAGSVSIAPVETPAPWEEDSQSTTRFFDSVNSSGGETEGAISSIYPTQERQAGIVATAAASGGVSARAVSNCCQLTPGYGITLAGHATQSGDWLVVAVEHTVTVEGRFWAGDTPTLSRNVVAELAPLQLTQCHWPPKVRPRVGGVCTAIVVGQGEAFLDMYGRVQVRFPWDRSESTQSCWLRVAQSWAGNGWGACFWPRVGHEVVVAFEHGDPDRPLVVGSVYNSTNMPPYPMPENKFIAGWKSLTEGGDPTKNFHQILMSDEKGAEIVHIHAESMFIAHQESQQVSKKPNLDVNFQG